MIKTKLCKYCGNEKKVDSFYKWKYSTDGYTSRCKICWHIKNLKVENLLELEDEDTNLKMAFTTPDDYKQMYNVLKSIGYDICSDIHSQFCDKHNISKKKKRTVNNSNAFSKEELDVC